MAARFMDAIRSSCPASMRTTRTTEITCTSSIHCSPALPSSLLGQPRQSMTADELMQHLYGMRRERPGSWAMRHSHAPLITRVTQRFGPQTCDQTFDHLMNKSLLVRAPCTIPCAMRDENFELTGVSPYRTARARHPRSQPTVQIRTIQRVPVCLQSVLWTYADLLCL